MNTRILMIASALFTGALGLAATFLPQEILGALGQPKQGTIVLVIQLLGALYLGFAMLDWMAKGSAIGGIYSRPLATGNLVHYVIAALALAKSVLAGPRDAIVVTIAILYALFAIAFASLLFKNPRKPA